MPHTVAAIPSGQHFRRHCANQEERLHRKNEVNTNVLDNTNIITVEDINSEYPVSKGSIKTAPIPTVVAYTMDPASAGLGTGVWTLKASYSNHLQRDLIRQVVMLLMSDSLITQRH